jgi:RNA polymerase sigma factor for flagellar operon FliA
MRQTGNASASDVIAGTPTPARQRRQENDPMESLLREAKEKYNEIPPALKEQIVLEHTPLIRYIVNRIAVRLPSHIDLDDLHNTGVIGLMDAIEKYDPEKNCKFKTYAEFRIKGAILDQLRSLDWVPRSVRQKSRRLEKAYGDVEQRLGRSASEDEVADSLGIQIDKFHDLLNQVRGISLVNLEEIRGVNSEGDRSGTFADIVEDVHSENPFASLKLTETRHVIADTIATLPEKERLVISLYYYEDLNMKEIGNILGITESRVCQIHTKSVLRLRSKLKGVVDR